MRNLHAIGLPTLALLALGGCTGSDYQLTAEDQLTLSAISGREDPVTIGAFDESAGTADSGASAPGPQPGELGRVCDAPGDFAELFDSYDADGSKALEKGERTTVQTDHAGQPEPMREDLMRVLTMVYDADGDGALSDAERATLLDDFTVRCEVLQDKMIELHDADGDGALAGGEMDGACDGQRAENEAMQGQLEGECPPPPPEGEAGGPPPGGDTAAMEGPPPEGPPPSCFVDSLVAQFDADGDGQLDETELAELQQTVRARILAGERFHGDPA